MLKSSLNNMHIDWVTCKTKLTATVPAFTTQFNEEDGTVQYRLINK